MPDPDHFSITCSADSAFVSLSPDIMLDPLNRPKFNECDDMFVLNPETGRFEGRIGYEECGFKPSASDYYISWEGSLLSDFAQVKETSRNAYALVFLINGQRVLLHPLCLQSHPFFVLIRRLDILHTLIRVKGSMSILSFGAIRFAE